MRVIRVGRRRDDDQRCAYCHADVEAEAEGTLAVACEACGARLHADCWEELGRCPARGCAGERTSAPAAGPAAAPAGPAVPAGPAPARADTPRPWPPSRRALARWRAPRARSALRSELAIDAWRAMGWLLFCGLLLTLILTHPAGSWELVSRGKQGELHPFQGVLLAVMILGGLGLGAWTNLAWLRDLPSVQREVDRLLDATRPQPMTLRLRVEGTGKRQRRWIELEGRGQQLELKSSRYAAGMRWLAGRDGQVVLVYGLPPPGPYVLELEDGQLALVHPD